MLPTEVLALKETKPLDYALLMARENYKLTHNELGFKKSEAMSKEANPNDPNCKYFYQAKSAGLDYSELALEELMKKIENDENALKTTARKFNIERIDL